MLMLVNIQRNKHMINTEHWWYRPPAEVCGL